MVEQAMRRLREVEHGGASLFMGRASSQSQVLEQVDQMQMQMQVQVQVQVQSGSLQSPCVPGRPANVRRRRLDGDLTARSGTGGGVEVPGSDEQVSEVTGRPLLPRPGRCVGLMSAVPSYLHGPAGYAGEGT